MLENSADPSASNAEPTQALAPIKRYAPPNQRNRNSTNLNRRKSGGQDRFERTGNLHGNDGDKNLSTAFKSVPNHDHGDAGGSSSLNDSLHSGFIALNGCSRSGASQLLHDRWEAAIHCYTDPSIDLSERPVMYTGNAAAAWGSFRLPHQLISGSQMDFLGELQRAICNHNANLKT